MRNGKITGTGIALFALGIAGFVACSSGGGDDDDKKSKGDDDDDGSGGSGGSADGGSGGAGDGGSGGSDGGSGGKAIGGSGGKAIGGMGGKPVGGMGGMPAGGMGGMANPVDYPKPEGPGVLWSGKVMTPGDCVRGHSGDNMMDIVRCAEKMVEGDTKPGYFHASNGDPIDIVEVDVPELKNLGIKYAFDVDVTELGMTVFAFNFREDDPNGTGFSWKYFDASAFAGFGFWAKSEGAGRIFFSYTSYDANSIGTNETSTGTCDKPTRPECGPTYVRSAVVNTEWSWVQLPFDSFNPVQDPKALGRVDMWTAGQFKMKITGLMFLKSDQLMN